MPEQPKDFIPAIKTDLGPLVTTTPEYTPITAKTDLSALFSGQTKEDALNIPLSSYKLSDLGAARYVKSKYFTENGFSMFEDNESKYYNSQTGSDIFWNRINRWRNVTADTFANYFQYGDQINSLLGNNMAEDEGLQESANLHKAMEDIYPIFRNPESQGLGFFSYFGKGAGQKWGEIFEQSAFTVGTIAGGTLETIGLAIITAELGGAGGWANAPKTVGQIVNSIKKFNDIKKLASMKNLAGLTSLGKITQGVSMINKGQIGLGITRTTLGAIQAVHTAASEAMIEGIHNSAEFTEAKIEEYKKAHNGEDPTPEEMEKIVNSANSLYTSTFYGNIPMLMASNALQQYGIFGIQKGLVKAITRGAIAEGTAEATSLAGKQLFYSSKLAKFVTREGLSTTEKLAITGKNLLRPFLLEPLSEGVEEFSQLVIQKGAYDHYDKRFSLTNDDIGFFEAIGQGLSTGLDKAASDEGSENFWAGFFGGSMYMGPAALVKSAHATLSGQNNLVKAEANRLAEELNEGMSTALRLEFANDANTLNAMFQDRITDEASVAMQEGKNYEADNLKHASLTEAVATAVRTGKIDSFVEGLKDKFNVNKAEFEAFLGRPLKEGESAQNIISTLLTKVDRIQRSVEAVDNLYPEDNIRSSKRFAKIKAKLERAETPEEQFRLTEEFMKEIAAHNGRESARRMMVHQLSSIENVEARRAEYDDRLHKLGLDYQNSKMLFNDEAYTETYEQSLAHLSSLRDRRAENKKTLAKLDPKKDKAQIKSLELDNIKLSEEIEQEDRKSSFLEKHKKGDIALRRKHKLSDVSSLSVDEAEKKLEKYYKDLSNFLEENDTASILSELFNKTDLVQGVYTFDRKQAIAVLIDSSRLDHDVLYNAETFKILSNKKNFKKLSDQFAKDNIKYQRRIATLRPGATPVVAQEEQALPEDITYTIIPKENGKWEVLDSNNTSHGEFETEQDAKDIITQLDTVSKEEQTVPSPTEAVQPIVVKDGVQLEKNAETNTWILTQDGNSFEFNSLQEAKDFVLEALNARLFVATDEAEIAQLTEEIESVEAMRETPLVSLPPGTKVFFEGNAYTIAGGKLEDGKVVGPFTLKNEDGNVVLQNGSPRQFTSDQLSLTQDIEEILTPVTPTGLSKAEIEFQKVPPVLRRLMDRINANTVKELRFSYQPYNREEKAYHVTNLRTSFENGLWNILADKVGEQPDRKFRVSPDPTDKVNQRFKFIIEETPFTETLPSDTLSNAPEEVEEEESATQRDLDILASQLRAQYNILIPGTVLRTTAKEDSLTDEDKDSLSYKRMIVKNSLLLKAAPFAYNIAPLGYQLKIQLDREDLTDDLAYFNKVKGTDKHPVVATIIDSEGNEVKFSPEGEISEDGVTLSFNILSTDRDVNKLVQDRAKYFKNLFPNISDKEANKRAKEIIDEEVATLNTLKKTVRTGESVIIPSAILSRGFEDDTPHKQVSLNDSSLKDVDIQVQTAKTTLSEAGKKIGVSYVTGKTGSLEFVSPIYMPSINSPGIKELIIKLVSGEDKDFQDTAPDLAAKSLRTEFLQNILFVGEGKGIVDVTYTSSKVGLKLGKKQYANTEKEVEAVLKSQEKYKININRNLLSQPYPFTFYKLEGDKVMPVKYDSYFDFIKSIATISIPQRMEELSQNVNKNIVLSFDPKETKVVNVETEELPPPVTRPSTTRKTSKLAAKSAPPKKEKLLRAKDEVDNSAPMSQTELDWVNKTFPGIGRVNFLKDIVNSNAWGQWTTAGGIVLYADAIKGTGYHEAWHEFSQLYLTKAQKMKLYKEVTQNVPEFQGFDPENFHIVKRIEEFLADDFMNYKLSNASVILKNRPDRNTIFRQILNFLRKFFGVENFEQKIDRLYTKLHNGNLTQKNLAVENVIFTSPLDRTKIPGFAELELAKNNPNRLLKATMDWFDFVIAYELYENNTVTDPDNPEEVKNARLNILDLFSNESMKIKGYQAVQDEIEGKMNDYEDAFKEASGDEAERLGNLYEYFEFLHKNFPYLRRHHAKLNTMGLEDIDKTEIIFDEEGEIIDTAPIEEDENSRGKSQEWNKVGNEKYSRDIASKQVKFMIKTLPQLELNPDYNYREDAPSKKYNYSIDPEFELNRNVNFERMWATLANKLESITDPREVYNKIGELVELEPAFGVLLNRLPPIDSTNINDQLLLNRFLQDFKFFNKKIMVTQIEIRDDGNVTLKNIHGSNNADKSLGTDMREEMKKKATDPEYTLIQESTKGAYLNLEEAIFHYHKILPLLDSRTIGHLRHRTEFLRQLGFIISPKTENTTEFQDYISKSMGDAADSRSKGIIPNIMNFLEQYHEKTAVNEEYDVLSLLNKGWTNPKTKKVEIKGLSNEIKKLLNFELIYSDQYIVNSVYDANNKLVYENSYYSMFALIARDLNDVVKYPTFQDILADPSLEAFFNPVKNTWVKHSMYLNSMFELQADLGYGLRKRVRNSGEFVRLQFNNYSGLSVKKENEESQTGKTTTDLDPLSKIMIDIINVVTKGKSPLLRNADKSSENEVGLTQYSLANKTVNNPVGTDTSSIVRNSLETLNPSHNEYKVFENYLVAELKRIYKIKHLKQSSDVFNTKGGTKGVSVLERGSDFILFDEILSPDMKATLHKALSEIEATEYTPEVILKIENIITDALRTPLAKEIGAFLEKEVEDYKNEFSKYGYTKEILEYYFKGTDPKFSKKEQEIMRSYVLNQRIHFVEQTITVFGDPMYFADPFKRFPYAASSIGTTPNLYPELTDFFNLHDQSYRLQAKLLGEREGDATKYVRPYDEKTKTSVLADVKTVVPADVVADWIRALDMQNASEAEKKKVFDIYSEAFVEPDAQGICTLDFYRLMKFSLGYWYPKHEIAYNKLIKGLYAKTKEEREANKLTPAEYYLFAPEKLGYSGPIEHQNLALPGYHKFSLVPILPITSQDTNISALNEKMLKEKLDYITFESGSKLSILANAEGQLDSLYTDMETREITPSPFTQTTTFMKFYKEQVQIEPKKEKESLFGTQFRKLLFSNKFEDGVPIDFKGENWNALSEEEKIKSSKFYNLEKQYQNNIRIVRDYNASKLFKQLGINEDANIDDINSITEINSEKLVELLEKEVLDRNYPESILEFFEVDDKGQFKYPLESSVNKVLLQKILLSLINNRIVRQKTSGQQMVQAAQTGYEFKFDKLDKSKGANTLLPYRIKWNESGTSFSILPMEVMVSFSDAYRPLLNELHSDGEKIRSIRRLNQMMENEEFRNSNQDLLSLIGYRIPTQALSSMENMTIRKFLPAESMNVIIVPSIITQKAGSDFDIDKLNILRPGSLGKVEEEEDENYTFFQQQADSKQADLDDPNKRLSKTKRATLEREIEELRSIPKVVKVKSTQQARIAQNEIIRIAKDVMASQESLLDLLTPNAVDIIQPMSNEISGFTKTATKKKYKTDLFSAITNIQIFNSFLGGASTIGIAAIANTMAQQFMRTGAKFNTFYIVESLKGNRVIKNKLFAQTLLKATTEPLTIGGKAINRIILSAKRDSSGKYLKSEIFSQYINAYVDVAKEPFIFNMNGGRSVAPVLMLMAHMGVPVKQAAYLANQPIIREYVSKKLEQEGLIAKTYASINKSDTEKDEAESIKFRVAMRLLKDYGLEMQSSPEYFMTNINKQQDRLIQKESNILDLNNLVLTVQKAPMSKELFNSIQQAALIEFISLEQLSSAVKEEMDPLKFDTDPISSVLSAQDRATKLERLLSTEPLSPDSVERKHPTLISKSSLHKIARESEISSFNVASLITKLYLDKYELISKPVVQEQWEILSRMPQIKNNKSKRETISRVWENDVIMFALQNYKKADGSFLIDDYTSLITSGWNSNIVTRLVDLKAKHPALMRVFPMLANLKEINSPKNRTDLKSVAWYGPKLSTELIEEYKTSWKQALSYSEASEETNQEIQEFFKDLIPAVLLTHGLSKSPNSFVELIPEEEHINLVLPAIMQMSEGLENASSDFYEKFQGFNGLFKRNNRRYIKGKDSISDGPVKQYKLEPDGEKFDLIPILSPQTQIVNDEKIVLPTLGELDENSDQMLINQAVAIAKTMPGEYAAAIVEQPLEALEEIAQQAKSNEGAMDNVISFLGEDLVRIALALHPNTEPIATPTHEFEPDLDLPPWGVEPDSTILPETTPEETFNKTDQKTLKSKKFNVFLQSEMEKNPNVTIRQALDYYKKCKQK